MNDWVLFAFVVGVEVLVIMLVFDLRYWWRHRHDNDPLQPGNCECTHPRSTHAAGKGRCNVGVVGANCACVIYVPVAGEDRVALQEIKRLRKMAGLDK